MVPALAAALACVAAPAAATTSAPQPPPVARDVPVLLLAEAQTGQILWSTRQDLRFVPASMTKAMTALVAFELLAQGKLRADQRFTVRPGTASTWSGRGTSMHLRGGESVSVDALLRGIATVSANDAAVVLAEGVSGSIAGWTALMNAQAQRIGMTGSRFATPNGWPDDGATYVSARDMMRLGQALTARHPQLYRRYFGQKHFTWNGVTGTNHDPAIGVVPGADGIKTGYTRKAGYNFLGSAERGGRRLLLVVGGARSEAARAAVSRAMLEWGFAAWRQQAVFAADRLVGEARVRGGDARRVGLVTQAPVAIAVAKDLPPPRLATRIEYRAPIMSPVARGAQIARLIIVADYGDFRQEASAPLLAAQAIGKAGLLDRLWNAVMDWFS